jgi:hypothetical protein
VLERVQWNRAEAARILKVSYRTVLNKIAECQLGGSSDHVMPCLTISSSRSCSDLIAHVPEFR